MGRESSAAINYELTNFAAGKFNETLAQDGQKLALRLAPIVQVPGATGQFKSFNDINAFQIYNTARPVGGDPVRIEFAATDPSYACKPHALEITIDEWEAKQVGESPLAQQLLAEGKIGALVSAAARADAKDVVDTVLAAVSPEANRGNWDNKDVDPIDQLDEQLDILSLAVGSTANIRVDMDVSAWRVLRNHPKVKARVQNNQSMPLTREQLVANLLFPVDLNVANVVYHSTKLGQSTQTKARLLSSVVLIYFSVDNPTIYDPSAFKRFSVGMGTPVAAVRSYQSPSGIYEAHFLDWSKDIKQTGTTAMKRLNITVPA